MRLICPNCDAEYQVDDAAIPDSGRDVQCSNCGHAWFQMPPDAQIARDAEEEVFGAAGHDLAPAVPPPPPEPPDLPPSPPPSDPDPGSEQEMETDAEPAQIAATETPRGLGPRQTLAESVLSVLREEAARETAVRRDEAPLTRLSDPAGSMEMQPELGLESNDLVSANSGSTAAQRHIARLKGVDPDLPQVMPPHLAPEAEPKAAARRDLLPDIEEINSTLRADTDRAQQAMDDVDALPNLKPRRRGFRSGFILMLIVAVVLAMAYVMAPRIVAQMPGSAASMRAYVAAVDRGRLWLDGVMKSASGSVRDFSGDGN